MQRLTLTERDRELVEMAIREYLESGDTVLNYEWMRKEYEELLNKITTYYTKHGTPYKKSFYPQVSGGEGLGLYSSLCKKGFKEVFYNAPYHWALANPGSFEIYEYCEGDLFHLYPQNREQYRAEILEITRTVKV